MQKTLPIHFAPLQGYTDVIYRNAHAACFGGIDAYYTPFVRLEKGTFRHRDVRGIEPGNNQVPHLIPQLIAPTAEKAEKILSLFIEKGYKEADINMGCPFPILAKRHNGSGILPYPEEVQALLSLITKYPQISFSIKMRLGWEDPEECLKLAPIINELPLRQVVMHPRLGKQQYKGEVDLKAFEAFQHVCKHPLIYNGDINHIEDIHRIQEQFPRLAGMMIGRGLLANPALAWEYQQNRTLEFDEMKEKIQSMHTYVYEEYIEQLKGGDLQILNKMKAFWEYLLPNADRKLLKAIHKSTNLHKYTQAVHAFFNQR
ncbi:tRNA-dihydrouridine synthase family protein [Bacteroides sp. AM16-13]|uniref:tRNA-dihydrouridine synthase family protein n=1 Tax=Bacteroides sp. AM16-13 TaxID=2292938 RepID=UPI000E70867E|nr:tRNA-dihydrouridine synthase family protein [Bacteroides sp. AM16-13]RGD50903.1 tRNA-dihydrouridine synthase family protein [Bacteroides sp. AM16-13]